MPQFTTDAIPYQEFRAINYLRRHHGEEHEAKLRGLIAFGDLIGTGDSADINLLEVVENWGGPHRVQFKGTSEFPLRGRLNIFFLTPEEFECPGPEVLAEERFSTLDLLEAVRKAYVILLERPENYVRNVLGDPVGLMAEVTETRGYQSPQEFFAQYTGTPSH